MSNLSAESGVIWEGNPWVLPGLIGLTVEAILLIVALSYLELGVLKLESILAVEATFLLVGVLWLAGAARLAILSWSNHYTLRGSSLEVRRGVVGRRIFTVSSAGFSDLEVIKGLAGRLLNMGDIVIETDSDRDLSIVKIRDPIKVATLLRQVMTVPLVRVASDGGVPAADRA